MRKAASSLLLLALATASPGYAQLMTAMPAGTPVSITARATTEALTPPYSAAFDSDEAFATLTTVDANNDGLTWTRYNKKYARLLGSQDHDSDDWLITPALHLEQGKVYEVRSELYGSFMTDEKFELAIGTAPTAEAMTTILIEPTVLEKVSKATPFSTTFRVPATGDYHIGLHGISAAGNYGLFAKTLTVSAGTTLAAPASPAGIHVAETGTRGTVKISWEPVTTDQTGEPLGSSTVSYAVYAINDDGSTGEPLKADLTDTEFTVKVCGPDDDQRFAQFAVAATTEGGTSAAASEIIPVGRPYAGMEESFAGARVSHLFGINNFGTKGAWIIANESTFLYEKSYDNDGGFLYFEASYYGDKAEFFTGNISLEEIKNPALKFYTRPFASGDNNLLEVKVRRPGQSWQTLLSKTMPEISDGTGDWLPVVLPLDDFAAEVLQVAVCVTAIDQQFAFIDKLAVEPLVEHDLRVTSLSAPSFFRGGYDCPVTVKVENKGTKPATGYTLEVYADGELAATRSFDNEIAPEQVFPLLVETTMPRFVEESATFTAKVIYEPDEVPANDLGPAVSVDYKLPDYPPVESLTGSYAGAGNTITWELPDLDQPDRLILENFEQAPSWDQSLDGWIFIDRDGGAAGGVVDMEIPGIRPQGDPTSFFIFDSLDGDWGDSFLPASGRKCLVSLYSIDNPQIDDWAISPELNGQAQTISLNARSYRDVYPETMEIYYSTGSTDPDDFILLEGSREDKVPHYWTSYVYDLPQGAQRFAIRSCGFASMMLMIDDVQFTAAPVTKGLELQGFDIYRDYSLSQNNAAHAQSWTDELRDPEESYTYTVIPRYNLGEGQPAHVVISKTNSVALPGQADIIVSTGAGVINISGAEGLPVSVTGIDGISRFTGTGTASMSIRTGAGLMIVKAGSEVVKINVR